MFPTWYTNSAFPILKHYASMFYAFPNSENLKMKAGAVAPQARTPCPIRHRSARSPSALLCSSNPRRFIAPSLQSVPSSRSLSIYCCSASPNRSDPGLTTAPDLRSEARYNLECESQKGWNVEVGDSIAPSLKAPPMKFSLSDHVFFLLAFITCTTSVAFTRFVVAAVPTLNAMGRAAISFAKLADTARLELPGTMTAMRLSSIEISDLTLELNDLSQEVADGIHKSARAVKAAKAGIQHISARARQQTLSMIEERASLPVISLRPVVEGAAKKTSRAIKGLASIIHQRAFGRGG